MSDVCRMTGSSNKTYTQPLADVFFHMQMRYSRYMQIKITTSKNMNFAGYSRMNILRLKSPIEKLNFTDFTTRHHSIHWHFFWSSCTRWYLRSVRLGRQIAAHLVVFFKALDDSQKIFFRQTNGWPFASAFDSTWPTSSDFSYPIGAFFFFCGFFFFSCCWPSRGLNKLTFHHHPAHCLNSTE